MKRQMNIDFSSETLITDSIKDPATQIKMVSLYSAHSIVLYESAAQRESGVNPRRSARDVVACLHNGNLSRI